MSEKSLEILLKAKNETGDAFRALQAGMSGVKQEAEAQTQTVVSGIHRQLQALGDYKVNWTAVGAVLGTAAAGVTAATAAIVALGNRGAVVGDVRREFGLLAGQIGITGDQLLGSLRRGTVGAIADFDLMRIANKAMSVGIKGSQQDFEDLAAGARILAKRTGGDTVQAFEGLTQAMATGRVMSLRSLGITIDSEAAQDKFAASIGKTRQQLTESERVEAGRAATLEALRGMIRLAGDQSADFGEKIAAARVRWSNFTDDLGVAISISPAVNKALDMIGQAALDAFGNNQEDAIRNIVGWVDKFAIFLVDAGGRAVTVTKWIGLAWLDLKVAFDDTGSALVRVFEISAKVQAWQREQMASIPGMGRLYETEARRMRGWADELESLRKGYQTNAESGREAVERWRTNLDGLKGDLSGLSREMQEAARTGTTQNAVVAALTTRTREQSTATEAGTTKVDAYTKKLRELTAGLQEAERNQAPATVVMQKYGRAITDVVTEATLAGKTIPAVVEQWYQVKLRNELTPIFKREQEQIRLTSQEVQAAQEQFKAFQVDVRPVAMMGMPQLLTDSSLLKTHLEKLGIPLKETRGQVDELTKAMNEAADYSARQMLASFDNVARGFGGLTGSIVGQWNGMLDMLIASSEAKGGAVWKFLQSPTGQKVTAGVELGMQTFGQGFGLGQGLGKTGGTLVGAGVGAAQGALVGTYIMPGVGTALGAGIGAIAGGIGGFFGGRSKDKADAEQLKDLQQQLLQTYGGMAKLRDLARELGVNIDRAFDTKKPKDALAVIEQFADATQRQKDRFDGLAMAADGLNNRALAAFDAIQSTTDEIGTAGEATLSRLETYASAVFAGWVRETGDVIGALNQIAPTLDVLQHAQQELGFTGSETINRLLGIRETVKSNEEVFRSLKGLTQMAQGFGQAGLMTRDLFQTVAGDIGANLAEIIGKGTDVNDALALAGPTLQWLWEQQQKFGGVTDDTTKSLLEQAEAQGLVGTHMRSVNEQILQATLGITDAIKELSAVLRGELPNSASFAADAIQQRFAGVRISIPVEYDDRGYEPPRGGGDYATHGFASGGYVPFTPGGRTVRVGEAGTERIVSDAQLGAIIARAMHAQPTGGPVTVVARIEIGGRHIKDEVIDVTRGAIRNGQIAVPKRAVVDQVY